METTQHMSVMEHNKYNHWFLKLRHGLGFGL